MFSKLQRLIGRGEKGRVFVKKRSPCSTTPFEQCSKENTPLERSLTSLQTTINQMYMFRLPINNFWKEKKNIMTFGTFSCYLHSSPVGRVLRSFSSRKFFDFVERGKFRSLTVVLPIEKIIREETTHLWFQPRRLVKGRIKNVLYFRS